MKNKTTQFDVLNCIAILKLIKNKGHCFYTTSRSYVIFYRALSYLLTLKQFLSEEDYFSIYVAIEHKILGEGSNELVSECNRVIKKLKETKKKGVTR